MIDFPGRSQAMRWQRGFTLIEIMVVVVIIGILAALIAPTVINRVDDAQISRVQNDIRAIESALQLFRMDNFRYPTTDEGLAALVERPNDPNIRNWRAYLSGLPRDPWDNPYQYVSPGVRNTDYDIFSYGADARPGGEGMNADIGNWDID